MSNAVTAEKSAAEKLMDKLGAKSCKVNNKLVIVQDKLPQGLTDELWDMVTESREKLLQAREHAKLGANERAEYLCIDALFDLGIAYGMMHQA